MNPSKLLPYVLLLAASKVLRSVGVYLLYDLLKVVHYVQILFLVQLCASACFVTLQKPFSNRNKLPKLRLIRHALIGTTLKLLWLYGLTLCGPLRTLIMFEHSDVVVIATLTALFTIHSSPSKLRGGVLFVLSFVCLMFFDHDLDYSSSPAAVDNSQVGLKEKHEGIMSHLINHLISLTGLSDHKGGVLLITTTLCLTVAYNTAAKALSLDIGGAKKLNALSNFISLLILTPWVIFTTFTTPPDVESWFSIIVTTVVVSLFVVVLHYYVEAISLAKLESTRVIQISSLVVLTTSVLIGALWDHPVTWGVKGIEELKGVLSGGEHLISLGVLLSVIFFLISTLILTRPTIPSRGSLVGFSTSGPLYNYSGDAFLRTQSIFTVLRNGLQKIVESPDSRKIFYFLCINFSFTFIELIYGVWTNSLGLISDGFHMFFDCSALVMGLYASVMSHWKASRIFSYGYDRVEVLSGFINGIFLLIIAIFVFITAIFRLFDPPDINTDRLLLVSVAGLLVNLIGITAFRHTHSHGGKACHSSTPPPQHTHSHSHGQHNHQHSHSPDPSTETTPPLQVHNTNMEGVFLHIMADTLGSVGVIVSTFLIQSFGWKIADPICSLFISLLIFFSVLPLVRETCFILLLRIPVETNHSLTSTLQKLNCLEGVVSYSDHKFWRHSSTVLCGSIHVQVQASVVEQKMVPLITAMFKEIGYNNICVQLEKPAFYQHLTGLGVNDDKTKMIMNNYCF